MSTKLLFMTVVLSAIGTRVFAQTETRPRVRDLGVEVGILSPGPLNAITDVAGVKVGQITLIRGDSIRTGVTAILPHGGNLFKEKVPGAVFVGNTFGKLAGSTQVNELGEIETPILLTSTLSVPKVADALVTYMLNLKGNDGAQSVNPLVGETNDGYLNDIRSRPIAADDVFAAITDATEGPVEEGVVGARDRHRCFWIQGRNWNVIAAASGLARCLHGGGCWCRQILAER
jgi:D-aminopeptidase